MGNGQSRYEALTATSRADEHPFETPTREGQYRKIQRWNVQERRDEVASTSNTRWNLQYRRQATLTRTIRRFPAFGT